MNNFFKAIGTGTVLSLVIASQILAQSDKPDQPMIKILDAQYGGNGCPSESAKVTLAPDGQSLAILFEKFTADGRSPSTARKTCNIIIPVKVPKGYQVSFFDVEYRGYVAPETTGRLTAEYFFSGGRNPVRTYALKVIET